MGQAVFKRVQFPCNYFGCKASHVGAWQERSPPFLLQQSGAQPTLLISILFPRAFHIVILGLSSFFSAKK